MTKILTKLQLLNEIEKWSGVYDFSFQFWGEANNNVFINKGSIEVASFGGENTIQAIFRRTLDWVNNENPDGFPGKEKKGYAPNRCGSCGTHVAPGNDYCGECMCEDDGYL